MEITNHGTHVIKVHKNAIMVQLILIASPGPILVEYAQKATQRSRKGFDEGLPYKFWAEKSIKNMRKEKGGESIIELYNTLRKEIVPNNIDGDVKDYKTRFDNTFLAFCHKAIRKDKFINQDNNLPNIERILKSYTSLEKLKKQIFSIRIISIVMAIIVLVKPVLELYLKIYPEWIKILAQSDFINHIFAIMFDIKTVIIYGLVFILLTIKKTKAFCTFEKTDIEKSINKIINKKGIEM